ncbi:MAG: MBL fold metallo-hydrolase [Clostridia bacterium]|nr:MBL fold metallo-hydrolase [Clostridia bacterium]
MLQVHTLFSGSSGNSIYVKGDDAEFLIDAGRSCGAIERALNQHSTSLSNISAIFITHEHSDHTQGLEIISKKYGVPIYMTTPSYREIVKIGTYTEKYTTPTQVLFEKSLGSVNISSFSVPHDSKQNVGYIISSGNERFGIATDIGHLTDEIATRLCDCQRVIVESNHDVQMVKDGPYPTFLKERILSGTGHLSNETCSKFLCYLADKGVSEFTLAHLSRENNTPLKAFTQSKEALCACGFDNVCLKVAFADISVCATDNMSYPYPILKETK